MAVSRIIQSSAPLPFPCMLPLKKLPKRCCHPGEDVENTILNMPKMNFAIATSRWQPRSQQPKEQAVFRKAYSTVDHMHVVNQVIEKCAEYTKPLRMAVIDYGESL